MGRKGIGALAGARPDYKTRKKTAVGLAKGALGRTPGESFLTTYARSRGGKQKLEEEQAARQESARDDLRERFRGRDTRGSILARLFG